MSYPVLFVKNIGKSTVSCSGNTFGSSPSLEVEPGKIEELPYLVAITAEFQRVWAAGKVQVAATYDFASPLSTLPAPLAAPNASTSVKGLVNQAAAQSNFAGADAAAIVVELNAFLAKLKTAGIVA